MKQKRRLEPWCFFQGLCILTVLSILLSWCVFNAPVLNFVRPQKKQCEHQRRKSKRKHISLHRDNKVVLYCIDARMLTHRDRNLRSMRFELGRRWECQTSLSISAKWNESALRADFQNHLQPSPFYAVCYAVSYTLVPRAAHQLKWYPTGSVLSQFSAACCVEFP